MSDIVISTETIAVGDEIEITTTEALLSTPSSPVQEQSTATVAAMTPGGTVSTTEAAENSQIKQKRKYVRKVPLKKKIPKEPKPRKRTVKARVKASESSGEEKANFASVDTVESASSGSGAESQDIPKANVDDGTKKGRGRSAVGRGRNRSTNRGGKRTFLTIPVASSTISSTSVSAIVSTEVPVANTADPKINENEKKISKEPELSTIMEASFLDVPQEPKQLLAPSKEDPMAIQKVPVQLSLAKQQTTTIVPVTEQTPASDSDINSIESEPNKASQPAKKISASSANKSFVLREKMFFTVPSADLNRLTANNVKFTPLKNGVSAGGVGEVNSAIPAINTSRPVTVKLSATSSNNQKTHLLSPSVSLHSDLEQNANREQNRSATRNNVPHQTGAKRFCSISKNARSYSPYSYGSRSAMAPYYRPSPVFPPMYGMPNLGFDADGDNQFLHSIASYLEMVHRDDKLVVRQRIMDVLIEYQKNIPIPGRSRLFSGAFQNSNKMSTNDNRPTSAAASAPSAKLQEEVNLSNNQDNVEEMIFEEEEELEETRNMDINMIYDNAPGPRLNAVSNEGDNVILRTSSRGNKGVPPGRFGQGEYVSYDL